MGCKTCVEKVFGVDVGPRGFRSGIPSPLIAPFVVVFIGIFFIVGGILLCIIHETYIVARHDQLYEADNYFLIAGVVSLCLGVVIVLVGLGWCYHARASQADQIEDYKLRKGYSSESINRSRPGSMRDDRSSVQGGTWSTHDYQMQGMRPDRMTSSASYYSHHKNEMPLPPGVDPRYPPHDPRYPHGGGQYPPHQGGQYPHGGGQYPHGGGHYPHDPNFGPGGHCQSPPRDFASRADQGFSDFKQFVNRNREAARSPRKEKQPYSDRLSRPTQGYTDDDLARQNQHGSDIEEGEFDLAKQYIQNPAKYYAENAERNEDALGGYEGIPADDPNRRAQERKRFEGGSHDPRHRFSNPPNQNQPGSGPAPTPSNRGSAYKYDNGRPSNAAQPMGNDPNNPQGGAPGVQPTPAYRYDKGRPVAGGGTPLDSSRDSGSSVGDTSITMAPSGQAPPPPPNMGVGKEKATLVYNPKDGQWYYYYKGKPISKYDPHSMQEGGSQGPVYKYINGKPILLPPPDQPLR